MRWKKTLAVPLIGVFLISACGENEAAKANKKAINSSNIEISLRLARASEAAGDFPAAEKLYRQAVEKDAGFATRMELVEFYQRHNGERQALVTLSDALKNNPEDTKILRAIANIKIDAGEGEEALKILEDALRLAPQDALLYNSRGVALDMLGRHKAAGEDYEYAIALDPAGSIVYKSNLGMSYIMTGYYTKAIRLLEPLADSSESTPSVRQNLALAYGLKGDHANARKYGLRDVTEKQMSENLKFYNSLGSKIVSSKPARPSQEVIQAIPPIPVLPQ